MSAQQSQKALLLPAPRSHFAIGATSIPTPGPGTVLVRNAAVALNPIEWKIQKTGFGSDIIQFPAVIGADFAGVVVSLGEGVTALREGDRVVAQGNLENKRGSYQEYTIASADYAAKVPAVISFDEAASLPIGLMTAATGLYQNGTLGAGLRAPWDDGGRGSYAGTQILIIGGASSVGCYGESHADIHV